MSFRVIAISRQCDPLPGQDIGISMTGKELRALKYELDERPIPSDCPRLAALYEALKESLGPAHQL